jgi:hypothetical protein
MPTRRQTANQANQELGTIAEIAAEDQRANCSEPGAFVHGTRRLKQTGRAGSSTGSPRHKRKRPLFGTRVLRKPSAGTHRFPDGWLEFQAPSAERRSPLPVMRYRLKSGETLPYSAGGHRAQMLTPSNRLHSDAPGSSFSTLSSVIRLTSARSASNVVGMRRRRRAS